MIFDFEKLEPLDRYKLMSQSIIPRPIAWIVTENSGIINIAPFSYFTGLSSEPPTVVVSIGHKKDKSPKDTLNNIRKTKKCTICMVNEKNLEKMHFSSKELLKSDSEAEVFGIKTKRVFEDFPPMVEDVPVALFCELYQEIDLKGSKTIPLILEIKSQYVDEKAIKNIDRLSIEFEPVARIGKSYALLGKKIEAPRIP